MSFLKQPEVQFGLTILLVLMGSADVILAFSRDPFDWVRFGRGILIVGGALLSIRKHLSWSRN